MSHSLEEHRIPGIGPMRTARLGQAGITTLEQLVDADADALAALPGMNGTVVTRAVAAARSILATSPRGPAASPPEIPDGPPYTAPEPDVATPEPEDEDEDVPKTKPKHRRGLDGARRIESTIEWARRTRLHIGSSDKPPVKKARKRLKRLTAALSSVQRELIRDGVSKAALADLETLLADIERRLRRFNKRKPSKKRLAKISTRLRNAQKALRQRLD